MSATSSQDPEAEQEEDDDNPKTRLAAVRKELFAPPDHAHRDLAVFTNENLRGEFKDTIEHHPEYRRLFDIVLDDVKHDKTAREDPAQFFRLLYNVMTNVVPELWVSYADLVYTVVVEELPGKESRIFQYHQHLSLNRLAPLRAVTAS